MAELDNIPQKQTIEFAQVKIDDNILQNLLDLNQKQNFLVSDFGQIYVRKKEIEEELKRLDSILETTEIDFKSTNEKLKEVLDLLDEKYPQGRINLKEGTIQYQPGAPTRKQQQEQQAQQTDGGSMKVVKE
jgi:hypothetical protein